MTTSKPFKYSEREERIHKSIREVANNHPLATKITEAIFDSRLAPFNLDKLKETALDPIEPYENCDVLHGGAKYLTDDE